MGVLSLIYPMVRMSHLLDVIYTHLFFHFPVFVSHFLFFSYCIGYNLLHLTNIFESLVSARPGVRHLDAMVNVTDTVSASGDSRSKGQLHNDLHALGCPVETLLSFRHSSYSGGTHRLDAADETSGKSGETHKHKVNQEAQGHWLLRG